MPASTPTSSTLTRGICGVGEGDGLTEALGGAVSMKLGSGSGVPYATGSGVVSTKISSSDSRATSVA